MLSLPNFDLIHRIDHKMSIQMLDLVALVRCADRNNSSSCCHGGFDTRRRIFKDDSASRVNSEVGGSQQERVRERFTPQESRVVGCHADFRNCNPKCTLVKTSTEKCEKKEFTRYDLGIHGSMS